MVVVFVAERIVCDNARDFGVVRRVFLVHRGKRGNRSVGIAQQKTVAPVDFGHRLKDIQGSISLIGAHVYDRRLS
jgi:hypothetical protein